MDTSSPVSLEGGTRTIYRCKLNKVIGSKFQEDYLNTKTPEEGRSVQQSKRCEHDNNLGTLFQIVNYVTLFNYL